MPVEPPAADEFMTLWDYVPDPGPMVRDPRWREIALHELTRPAGWTPTPVMATASLPPSDGLPVASEPEPTATGRPAWRWHHLVKLATDRGWERLASNMERTTPEFVDRVVGINICNGTISTGSARALLSAIGVAEPGTRSRERLMPRQDCSLVMALGGWAAVHAVEHGLVVPGDPKRRTGARVTDAGWRSVGQEPPAPRVRVKRTTAPPPSARLTAILDKAGLGRRSTCDVAIVEAAIAAGLPDGVPSFADEILSARRDGQDLVARVRLFDGDHIILKVVGGVEPSVREWEAEGDQRAFWYVDGAWHRFDEAEQSSPPETVFTAEELAMIESCLPDLYSYGPHGDAARGRWRAWILEGALVDLFSVPIKGRGNHADFEVKRTRLGWQGAYAFQFPDVGGVGGGNDGPHQDTAGLYLWADREAAIQSVAHVAWSTAVHATPAQTVDVRTRIAVRIRAEFGKLGIDATVAPGRDRRRRLIANERIEALRAARDQPTTAPVDEPDG